MPKWDDPILKKYMLRGMTISQALAQYEEDQQIQLQASQIAALAASTGTTVPTDPTPPPQGEPGVNGESAYQLWLDAGNTGTVEDFLASLVGPKGDKGDTGPQAGQEIGSVDIALATQPTTNNVYVTQGQIVVPAGTPAHEVEVIGGILAQIITGTQPVATNFRVDVSLFDEANTLVGYSAHTWMQDTAATSKTEQTTLPCKASLPAAPAGSPKTYTLQVRATNIGVNGAQAQVLIGAPFPTRKMVARYR